MPQGSMESDVMKTITGSTVRGSANPVSCQGFLSAGECVHALLHSWLILDHWVKIHVMTLPHLGDFGAESERNSSEQHNACLPGL